MLVETTKRDVPLSLSLSLITPLSLSLSRSLSLQETVFAMLVETTERAMAHIGNKEVK
jgi:hypothetical protein